MDLPDFYEEGLIAAKLAEEGKVDASYTHIRETLGELVSDTYRSQTNPSVTEKAQKLLASLDQDGRQGGIMMPKLRGIELMLFDRDVTRKEKNELTTRYRFRSVRHLTLARKHPYQAVAMEFLDDIVDGLGTLGKKILTGGKYAVFGLPMFVGWLGKKVTKGSVAYYHMTDEERKVVHAKTSSGIKQLGAEAGNAFYHTIEAIVTGAVLGGLFVPTGIRRVNVAFNEDTDVSGTKAVKSILQFLSGVGSFCGSCYLVFSAYGPGDQSFSDQIIGYGIPALMAASELYELGRFGAKRITTNKERLTSYQALPKAELFSAPVPSVQVRVNIDDDEIPIYMDEGLVYKEPVAMEKIAGDPQ